MNTETEKYNFFLRKVSSKKIIHTCHSAALIVHANDNTLIGSITREHIHFVNVFLPVDLMLFI